MKHLLDTTHNLGRHARDLRVNCGLMLPIQTLDVRSYGHGDSDVQIKFDCSRAIALELAPVFNCMTPAATMEVTA